MKLLWLSIWLLSHGAGKWCEVVQGKSAQFVVHSDANIWTLPQAVSANGECCHTPHVASHGLADGHRQQLCWANSSTAASHWQPCGSSCRPCHAQCHSHRRSHRHSHSSINSSCEPSQLRLPMRRQACAKTLAWFDINSEPSVGAATVDVAGDCNQHESGQSLTWQLAGNASDTSWQLSS